MSEDGETNYFALAAERCFGRRVDADLTPQVASSSAVLTPVNENVVSNEAPVEVPSLNPPTPTTNSDPPEPPSSVSSPEAPAKVIGDVIYLSSDEEDGEAEQILGKRRSSPNSGSPPFIKRRSSPMTAKLEPFTPRAFLALNASDDPISPPATYSIERVTKTTNGEISQCPTYKVTPFAPVSCDHEALHSSQRSLASQAATSADKALDPSPLSKSPSNTPTPAISPETATPSPGISFSEGAPSPSTLRAMIANGFTPSQETLETEDTDTNSPDGSIVDENENQIDEPSENEEDVDSDNDSDDGSFGYRQDNAADIEVFESDDEIEVLYDKFAEADCEAEAHSTDEADGAEAHSTDDVDGAEPRSMGEADEPSQLIKDEMVVASSTVSSEDPDEEVDDDNATIVISDSEESAADDFEDEDNSDASSYRSIQYYTYDDPQYDWINPFLNENFAFNGLDGRELITEYLAGINENEYSELFGERPVDGIIREVLEYMADTRIHQRGIRISRRLRELVEAEEEEEPWLPEKPKCLQLFSADPSVKPEPPNTYFIDESDNDGSGDAGVV